MSDDPVARSDELDRTILAIPADRVFTKRVIAAAFVAVLVPVLVTLALSLKITLDTNRAVERQVAPLQKRVLELEAVMDDQESVIDQQTDAILMLAGILQDNGITPPEIVIRPPED